MARESAHQLGTPLSSLAGWIELLEERASDDVVARGGRRTCAAISSASTASRIASSASDASPSSRTIDVGAIVERHRRSTFRRAFRRSPTRSSIESEIAPDLPVVHGDPRAARVGGRSADQERHRRARRTRRTSCAVASRGAEDDGVVIRVADDGPGVPRELRDRIFEPGFSTKKSGWGIGLSLAKRIVEENHGGKLVLAPTEQGATFEIILH